VFQVFLNVFATPNVLEGRDQLDRGIGFDHARSFAKVTVDLGAALPANSQTMPKSPNIVMLMTDDTGTPQG
jgi:hypothetical protein